ncbi:MAG: DUF5916 domain-containing protein [Vicinamibacteria bacterium]
MIHAPRFLVRRACALVLLFVTSFAWADSPEERQARVKTLSARDWAVTARRVQSGIVVDGRLDEADWNSAKPIDEFFQRERLEGLPGSERTEVRVLYDESNLYIAFTCFDAEIEKSTVRAMFRDENQGSDDIVSVMLDAFHDHRSAIQFVTNRNGAMEDLFQNGETQATRNHDWDTVWLSRGSQDAKAWYVEIAIPFKSLRFQLPKDGAPLIFGAGFKRNIPRKNEEDYWPFVSNNSSWYRPSELGHIEGIVDARPGRNLEILPYALAGAQEPRFAARRNRREAGFDAKWGVSSGITADFTVNTDFAQEEVDTLQINFTRFSLAFPEKRQFFLEGQRQFQFGLSGENDLVFTRRIGLSERGDPLSIKAGARLSGRQGRWSLGFMDLQTETSGTTGGENFAVARVRRDLFKRSQVGVVFTNREGGGRFNRVGGLDARFASKKWFVEGFGARVFDGSGQSLKGSAFLRGGYDADRYAATYRFLDVQKNFNPGLGFVRRPGDRQQKADFRFSPRSSGSLVRRYNFEPSFAYITDSEGGLATREAEISASAEFETGDTASMEISDTREAIGASFKLRDDVTIAPGAYDTTNWKVGVETFRRRQWKGTASYKQGGFWNGTRKTFSASPGWRFSKHVGASGSYSVNWIDLPQKRYTTHLFSGRVDVAFTTQIVLLSLLQYNSDTKQFSKNVRFNWIPKQGTDVFLVYSETDQTRRTPGALDRSLTFKLAYRFAL